MAPGSLATTVRGLGQACDPFSMPHTCILQLAHLPSLFTLPVAPWPFFQSLAQWTSLLVSEPPHILFIASLWIVLSPFISGLILTLHISAGTLVPQMKPSRQTGPVSLLLPVGMPCTFINTSL